MLEAGPFPPATLPDQDGNDVELAGDFVLFFYPADHTPGCTKQACAFRDAYQDFQDAGFSVYGISSQGEKSHQSFRSKHDLPFPLLVDNGGALRKSLGVPRSLGIMDGRVTFVVKGGEVVHTFRSQFNATGHVKEALAAIA